MAKYVATCDISVPTPEKTVPVKAGDPLDMADAGTIESMLRMGQAVESEGYTPPTPEPSLKKTRGK